ncbi:Vegetative incompatibility protein HET-E-1 [Fusarium austroafricanum]|uniref:Vegetative incompatibility protein HET-E-1 n=1 Tax=Fusarium austroafricanum TaxID=2364996 RepID=A0A8H4KTR0_9HYPO|nr:Vegetative incompatibility protein HET-E-1 [Fusarium austroafricanum]
MSAVAQITAPLTADVRLIQVVSEFGAALDEKYRPIFKTWQTLSAPTETDVIRLTEEVNRDGTRLHHSSWKPFGTRLFKFLDQIQFLVKPGDILVSGSQNMIASGVWATVRVSLDVSKPPNIAVGYLSYFEKVSDLLMQLGYSTIVQRDRMQLFPGDADLKTFSCEYLIVIIEICRLMVSFERKNFITQLANTIMLEKTFKDHETKLGFWSKLINKKLSYLHEQSQIQANTAVASIKDTLSFWSDSRRRQAEDWRIQVLHQLSPHQARFDSTWRRERRKGSVEWIFNNERFINWKSASYSCTLLLHGPLGSGKTVTMANITGKLQPGSTTDDHQAGSKTCAVAVFFFQFLDPETLNPTTVLGSIAYQFLKSLSIPVDHPAYRNYHRDSTINNTDTIVDYIKMYFPINNHYFLVLDGLDELSIDAAREILQPLALLQTHFIFHICCSVRTESCIRRLVSQTLREMEPVSISTAEKDREIESYIDGELNRRAHVQKLNHISRAYIREALVLGAQGMYLWVALQLDSLFPIYGESVVCVENVVYFLNHLPAGLFDAFEATLSRIQNKQYGSRIFELVAAAKRPLTKDELRSALNIKPGVTSLNLNTLPLDADAMVYCCSGGLLQIDEEDNTVHFMHHSVLRHLLTDVQSHVEHKLEIYDDEEISDSSITQSGLEDMLTGRSTNRGSQSAEQKHQQETFLFSSHQADTTIGYVCLTCLHLKPHDRRIRQSKKLIIDHKTCEMISTAVVPQNLMTNLMTRVLQGQAKKNEIPKFDIARIIEDLSSAPLPIDASEGLAFASYAEAHWLDHTSRACFNKKDELNFHHLFVKLVRDNDPGISLPWHQNGHPKIVAWARDNQHIRLLYELLRSSRGSDFESIVKALSKVPADQLTGLLCHSSLPSDAMSTFLLEDCCNVAGVDTLLLLGASPNEKCKALDEARASSIGHRYGDRLTPLQVALHMMFKLQSFEADVIRRLLQAGAEVGSLRGSFPPIILAIEYYWGAGYQILFSFGARVSHFVNGSGIWPISPNLAMAGLDLAMFRGADADDMIQDLMDCGAEIKEYFKEQHWPVSCRTKNANAYALSRPYVFSGESDDWVALEAAPQHRHYLNAEDPEQAEVRVLKWLCRSRCNVNIFSANGITPLGLAIESLDCCMVKNLLLAGADPNQRYQFGGGTLPLLSAAKKRDEEIARLLISRGASIRRTVNRKKILDLAVKELFDATGGSSRNLNDILDARNLKDSRFSMPIFNTLFSAVYSFPQGLSDEEAERINHTKNLIWEHMRIALA